MSRTPGGTNICILANKQQENSSCREIVALLPRHVTGARTAWLVEKMDIFASLIAVFGPKKRD
jgi:hypothetical protein